MPGANVVSTRRTPWVRGPSSVIDAMVIGGVTTDNGVYFERVVAYTSFKASGGKTLINPIGATIDQVINDGVAVAAAFVQDADATGLLKNYMEFVVQLPPDVNDSQITDSVLILMQQVFDLGAGGVEGILRDTLSLLAGHVGL